MLTTRYSGRIVLGLASGVVLLMLAMSLSGHSAPETKPAEPAPVVLAERTPKQVADDLDSIIQPRFQDLTAGDFGTSRIVPAVRGHESVGSLGAFQTNTPAEATLLARADAARVPYIIAFLHCAAVPRASRSVLSGSPDRSHPFSSGGFGSGRFGLGYLDAGGFGSSDFQSPTPASTAPVSAFPSLAFPLRAIVVTGRTGRADEFHPDYLEKTQPLLHLVTLKALPLAEKGKPAQSQAGDWALFLRPVNATQEACLSCHTTAKLGDTLGVMVYAVDKNPLHRFLRTY